MPQKKHKERKQFRKEIERFAESVTGKSPLIIKEVDITITYEDPDGNVLKIGNSIYDFEED